MTPEQAFQRNLSIIPTGADKRPLIKTWLPFQMRTATKTEFEAWLALNPPTWAIVTGAISRLITLDFDGEQGRQLLARLGLSPHRSTPSGGFHCDFSHPGWPVKTLNSKTTHTLGEQFPGLDIRGDGGYVCFAGRTHEGVYRWLRVPEPDSLDLLPADLREFLGLLHPPEQRTNGGKSSAGARVDRDYLIRRALERASSDGRNNGGFWLSCQLRDAGYSQSEAEAAMLEYCAHCGPVNTKGQVEPYTEAAALSSLKEAYSRSPRDPWQQRAAPHNPSSAPDHPEQPVTDLGTLVEKFREWLHMPDTGALILALATVAANRRCGDPVWLLFVGAPGSGKTEILNSLIGLPGVHAAAVLNEPALLSGSPKRETSKLSTGGLLRSIGDSGIILCKDFGSILSMRREDRASLLAALREIYDGSWLRLLGTDGGRALEWHGKVGLIGGVTPAIDLHHGVMASLGERFLLYRFRHDAADAEDLADCALRGIGRESEMRTQLRTAVKGFFTQAAYPVAGLNSEDSRWLVTLSTLPWDLPRIPENPKLYWRYRQRQFWDEWEEAHSKAP